MGSEMRQQKTELNFHNKWLFGMDAAGVQMNHGSSSPHAQWFSHQNGGADNCDIIIDIMRISHVKKGGNYKRGSAIKLKEFSCCYYCCLGVQAQVLGSLQSHRPSTSALSVPLK